MKTSNINLVKKNPLLEMDQVQLVHIYATKLSLLNTKQRIIFDLLSNGMRVTDIAKHLGNAEVTIKVVKSRIMSLLGVATLQELAIIDKCTSCNYVKHHL